ncbi:MAG: uracil-DNA glycosylase family protein [Bacteroidota bacterium]
MLQNLLSDIRQCKVCESHLPLGANPVVKAGAKSKILVVGQAPGTKVHTSGIPWDDQSGKRLREWLDIDEVTFYDESIVAIMPMGFCYPGKGKSGDLPPRKECAPLWHKPLLEKLPEIKLTLLIGQYAQKYYLEALAKTTVTETVKHFKNFLPDFFPLPHPSPRNNIWMRKNPWFESTVIPELRERVHGILIA